MLNTFGETFEVTEMRTFKHEPFFIVGGGGGGAYSSLYGICTLVMSFFRTNDAIVDTSLHRCTPMEVLHTVILSPIKTFETNNF